MKARADVVVWTVLSPTSHNVGHAEVSAAPQEAQLCGGTLSQRPVCLHVVHIPAGVLPLSPGLPKHICRLVFLAVYLYLSICLSVMFIQYLICINIWTMHAVLYNNTVMNLCGAYDVKNIYIMNRECIGGMLINYMVISFSLHYLCIFYLLHSYKGKTFPFCLSVFILSSVNV